MKEGEVGEGKAGIGLQIMCSPGGDYSFEGITSVNLDAQGEWTELALKFLTKSIGLRCDYPL